jgi:hypothetical protein
MPEVTAVVLALVLFGLWTLATYTLEGRIHTLRRPDAAGARFAYALVANILIGIVGAVVVVRAFVQARMPADPSVFGIAPAARIPVTVLAGIVLGVLIFALQRPPTWKPVVLLNGFLQTLVVSMAEVLVCWAVLGASVRVWSAGLPGRLPAALGLITGALAFGVYHVAHSPPFNAPRMVLFLSGVGVLTGGFFLASGDIYGTIVFHNFLALRGVSQALAESGRLQSFTRIQLPLVATAAGAVLMLVVSDVSLIRSALSAGL